MAKRQPGNPPAGEGDGSSGNICLTPASGTIKAQGGEAIIRNSDILEGKPYLAGTRMGVHAVVGYWQTYGGDVDRILREFPHLTREQIEAAMAFYRDERHQAEIDAILRRNRASYREGLARQR